MNERIRECWLKAAREDSGEKWDTQEEFIERFARLIVGECAGICFSEAKGHNMAFGEHCGIIIKEHFGVE
jgi:hypothetical protein